MAAFTDKQLLWVAGGVAVAGYLIWSKGLPSLGSAVNPTNPENVFYEGTNAVGEALTGDGDFSLGVWLYDKFNATDTITGN